MKNKKLPSMSVIILTRETPFMILKRCINCVRSQTLKDIEIILLDANEKGNSYQQAISSEGGFFRNIVQVFYPEEGEMVHGKNLALEKATADYITFLAAEDTMPETRLETVLQAFRNNPGPNVYYTGMTIKNSNTLEEDDYTLASGKYRYLSQAVFHRSAFSMVGNFDEHMLSLCDEELWMRLQFFRSAGYVMESEAVVSVWPKAHQHHSALQAAIAYRQMLVKFPKYFRRNKSFRRVIYQKIAENYKEAHLILRYLQFRWKQLTCR